ncbi:MAG: TolC family protein [Verrucomicrobia bacterium]|nr:TolC family protein [Verrucomicrobiota bacterium]
MPVLEPKRIRDRRTIRLATIITGWSSVKTLFFVVPLFLMLGCTASRYRKSADKEVYKIIQGKQQKVFGQTNKFHIETRYSGRQPKEIKAPEIIEDRLQTGKQVLALPEALRIAVENNRQYQLRKENLYLTALALTRERFAFTPQLFAGTKVTGERASNGDQAVRASTRAGLDALFKTGGRLALDLGNDLLRFYTGDPRRSAVSTISLSLVQPLLRGAGAKIVAENLTQAERNVIYDIRSFSYYQDTFAFDIVSTYLRLLQQQDTVRNQYNNFLSLEAFRKRAEALGFDRLPKIQVDQAIQDELRAKNSYILAVDRYRSSLDLFKITLGLPLGYEIQLDENALREIEAVGLLPVQLTETNAIQIALDKRLDLLNEIDIFEDSKRKIDIAADRLKPDLNLFADASLASERPTDYAKFDLNDYRLSGGVQVNLPINRLLERNSYRSALLSFERQIRTLALFLDDLKTDVRAGIRSLEQARQTYEIQSNARELARRRVESSELNMQAGRAQTRDVLEAQNASVQAENAVTGALVDYHLTRLRLLLDMGVLRTAEEKFWLREGSIPRAQAGSTQPRQPAAPDLITPEQLFESPKP